ncbi:MAG TPA: hypothetical protein PKM63_03730 [Panacibacter sp.]|nr:hypothetical protein [Panacibacter sp.]HNP43368.1 hypothetical protein [Panacibacter sp.]
MLKKIAHLIFFGNYFYGFCTVALAIEASLQQEAQLNNLSFYLALYFATIIYYTYAYIQERDAPIYNKRTEWYAQNRRLVRITQLLYLIICIAIGIYLLNLYKEKIFIITPWQLAILAVTGMVSLSYYGIPKKLPDFFNIRNTGWFKPFAIGLIWATVVTYVPILWSQVEQHTTYKFSPENGWFFVKNFMYISLLAILFDIKDYAADHNRRLKTFVVRAGLRKTIFLIIIPLSLLGLVSLLLFASSMHFPWLRIAINCIPFICLIIVALSMQQRKSIIYYLAVIDGLMLLKALCGIAAWMLLNK